MFRARRYRVFLIFTAIFILSIFYFGRSNSADVEPDVVVVPPKPPSQPPPPPPPVDNKRPPPLSKVDGPAVSELKPELNPESNPESKHSSQVQSPEVNKPPVKKPKPSFPAKPPSNDHADGKKPAEEEKNTSPPLKEPDHQQLESGKGGEGRVEISQSKTGKPSVHWKKLPEHFPVDSQKIIQLPTGKSKALPKLQTEFKDESISDKLRRLQRQSHIREAFQHAWTGYKKLAMGHDEVSPVTGGHRDPFNGWGATLVDGLDTLWIMDLREEFSIAVDEIKKIDFTTSLRADIPMFETTIRYLGGLLGAYDISGHKYTVLLEKAIELADVLMGAFDTPNRMPMLYYRWAPEYVSQPHLADSKAVLAEIGSLTLEFTRLAQLTKENKYYDAIARITNELEKSQDSTRLPGLWPLRLDASGCRKSMESSAVSYQPREDSPNAPASSSLAAERPAPTDAESYKNFLSRRDVDGLGEDAEPADYGQSQPGGTNLKTDTMGSSDKDCKEGLISAGPGSHTFGLGALADSTYEYMPKEHMLLGGLNDQYRKMYKKAMDTTRKHLLFQPMVKDGRDIRFIASTTIPAALADKGPETWTYTYEGTHLACFAGGMFAVGAKLFGIDGDMDIASKLTDGCVWAYESTKTGIMPESFHLLPCEKGTPCTWDETLYRKALDPQADMRAKQTEKLYEQKLQFAKGTQSKVGEADETVPAPPASFPAGSRQDAVEKHGAGDRRGKVTPPMNLVNGTSLARRDVAEPEKPLVLSHDDFVNGRIRNERLPPGFVDISARYYLLRPEAIESVFIMYRLTGDDYWREKGWKMFEAITRYTRTEYGHSAIFDVTTETPRLRNGMESFWLAETLKYFYLLFSDPSVVDLDEYVLNTEAHPLKRPEY